MTLPTPEQAVENAIEATRQGSHEQATAWAAIAQALVMLQPDAEAIVDEVQAQMRVEFQKANRRLLRDAEHLGEVEAILASAAREGRRHPAIHRALEVIRGRDRDPHA